MTLPVAAAPAAVRFDWLEYTGRDVVFEAPVPAGHYRNPILAGFYPDPSVCRAGNDYYLINSTFAWFPGIPVFRSRDLVHWTQIGNVVDRPGQLNFDGLGVSRGIFAPAISHHAGTFYVVCTMADAGGNFLMTASDPAGPWSDPVWLGFDGIDPSIFFDSDGRAWLINNGPPPDNRPLYQGHRAIWIQEFDSSAKKLIGPRTIIVNGGVDLAKKPVWIEGPHLYRRSEWYYLCCAEGGTGDNHSQVIFRSRAVTGPFLPWSENPILTQRDLDGSAPQAVTTTGHADMVVGPDGNWWAVFLGCRPYAGRFYNTGRETFLLPVEWTGDGWPRILSRGKRVPGVVAGPLPDAGGPVAMPVTGNFTWRDGFAGPALSPSWMMLRAPREVWWKTGNPHGGIEIVPRQDALSGKGNPSFLARRLQHARFTATVSLVSPAADNVFAGLAIFQNETHHYFLGMRRQGGSLEIFLERAGGAAPETVARAIRPAADRIELRITGDDQTLAFSQRAIGEDWRILVGDADATTLSTQAAGGFVGAMLGLFARADP